MEQITRNVDVLRTIFNYLNLKEQITVTHVSPEFQYIMVNYMWRYKYRHIKVYKLNGNTVILNTNLNAVKGNCEAVSDNFVDLRNKEFQTFLKLNQENFQEIELCDYRSNEFEENETNKFIINNKWKFLNLKILILQFVKLNEKDLEMIYRNCKHLETLRIKQCHNSNLDLITLRDHDNCNYKLLVEMVKKLKEFHLEYREMQLMESTLNLHDLLANNNLKHLNLNIPLRNLRYKETPRLLDNSCEILQIGNFNELKTLQKFTRLYLNSFQSLLNLTLEGTLNKIFIDSKFIKNLSAFCPSLKNINLKRCLINVEDFLLLSQITEINLDSCMSLTWRNLRQLLDLPLLQNFHSTYSTYTRDYENVFIPFNLKSLTLVGNEYRFAQIFSNTPDQLPNLRQLIYYDGSDTAISNISQKFPNLEILHILPHHIHLQDLFQLSKLKVFKLPKCQTNQAKLLSLLFLVKHPCLRQLSLTGGSIDFRNEFSIDLSNVKQTNLNYLMVDLELFNYMFEFLLDLINFNKKLKIIVNSDDIADFQYLYDLVQNRKFCRESVKLCGFQIDCKEFSARPELVKRKLELIRELSEYKNIYFVI